MAGWKLLRSLELDDIMEDPRYTKASEFKDGYDPSNGVDYSWVYDQARETLSKSEAVVASVDKKARDMLTYLAPGSGFLGVGFTLLSSQQLGFEAVTFLLTSLGVIFLLTAMFYAYTVLLPHQQTLGVRVAGLLQGADHYRDSEKAKAYCAAGLAESITMLGIVAEYKSVCLKRSFRFLTVGLLSLISATISIGYFFLRSLSSA